MVDPDQPAAVVPADNRVAETSLGDIARGIGRPAGGFVWLFAGMVLVAYWLTARATAQPLAFSADALANVGAVLAPLVLVAAFIERAVEVILTPWRGDESELIQRRLTAFLTAGNAHAAESEAVKLRTHKNGTRRRAFLLTVALGLVAALLGFRGIGSLVEAAPDGRAFVFFDVLMTGLVLAGGADGIHKPVKAFTDYMEMVSRGAKERVAG